MFLQNSSFCGNAIKITQHMILKPRTIINMPLMSTISRKFYRAQQCKTLLFWNLKPRTSITNMCQMSTISRKKLLCSSSTMQNPSALESFFRTQKVTHQPRTHINLSLNDHSSISKWWNFIVNNNSITSSNPTFTWGIHKHLKNLNTLYQKVNIQPYEVKSLELNPSKTKLSHTCAST